MFGLQCSPCKTLVVMLILKGAQLYSYHVWIASSVVLLNTYNYIYNDFFLSCIGQKLQKLHGDEH